MFGKRFLKKFSNYKNYQKVRDHGHFTGGAAHSIYNSRFNVPNEISVVFHNRSNYDYHFIVKELANEVQAKFECLGENTEKYKTFPVSIEKEVTNIGKDNNENVVTIFYKINLIDSARFMVTSLSNLVDDLKEGIHKIKCKDCFLDNLIKYKCLYCNKDNSNKIDEELKN